MEVISTIKEQILVSTHDFKSREFKEFTVKIVRHDNTIMFHWDVPKYITNELKNISPEKYGNVKNFVRTGSLVYLKRTAEDYSFELEKHHIFDDLYGDKMLFIRFVGSSSKSREGTYGGGMGTCVKMEFQYFVGYKFVGQVKKFFSDETVEVTKYSAQYQRSPLQTTSDGMEKGIVPLHRDSRDLAALESKYVIVPYTEQREEFLINVQSGFVGMIDKLNEFLKDLDEVKLDQLVSQNIMMLPPVNSKE